MTEYESGKKQSTQAVLELHVNNHPGVMSHVCGLLARRSYNMEAIICFPKADKNFSRIWLLLNEQRRLAQVIKQIAKLYDVHWVQHHGDGHKVFASLESFSAH